MLRREGYYEDGGTAGEALPAGGQTSTGGDKAEQLLTQIRDGIKRIPSRLHVAWGAEDTANVENNLDARQQVRTDRGVR